MEKVHYTWIDSCKTIGLLLVILGHGRLFPESYQQFIYSFHMPLFFVLSGLLYKYKSPKETFIHDIHRLLIPYLIINFICMAIQSGMLFLQNDLTWPEIFRRIIGVFCVACYTGDYPPASVPTWFIIALFFARMLLSIHDSKVYRASLTIMSVLFFFILKLTNMDPWLPIDSALLAIPFITGGILLKPLIDFQLNHKTTIVVTLIIFTLLVVLVFSNNYNGLVDMSWSSYGNSIILYYLNGFLGTFILLGISKTCPPVCKIR